MDIPIFGILQSLGGGLGDVCGFIPYCNLFMIGFKVFILVFIVGWVRKRLGGGTIASVVMLFVGYFVLFPGWFLFGPLGIFWLLALSHLTHLITTFGFAKGSLTKEHEQMEEAAGKKMAKQTTAEKFRGQ